MNPAIAPSVALYALNNGLFDKALDGLSREHLATCLCEASNPMLWITGHIANTRYGLAALLGRKLHRPWGDLFNRSAARPAEEAYPDPAVIRTAWAEVTATLMPRFEELTEAELAAPTPRALPTTDGSVRGAIAFFAYHEGYHLGQLSYIRRALGFPGLVDG